MPERPGVKVALAFEGKTEWIAVFQGGLVLLHRVLLDPFDSFWPSWACRIISLNWAYSCAKEWTKLLALSENRACLECLVVACSNSKDPHRCWGDLVAHKVWQALLLNSGVSVCSVDSFAILVDQTKLRASLIRDSLDFFHKACPLSQLIFRYWTFELSHYATKSL